LLAFIAWSASVSHVDKSIAGCSDRNNVDACSVMMNSVDKRTGAVGLVPLQVVGLVTLVPSHTYIHTHKHKFV